MADDGIKAGRAFLEAAQKDYQSQEKLQELRLRFSHFGEAMRIVGLKLSPTVTSGEIWKFVAQEIKSKLDEAKSQGEYELKKALAEIQLEFTKRIEKWESKYGPGYPESNEDLMREARRAGVDPKAILDSDGEYLMAMIEGYRLWLQDQSGRAADNVADKPKKKSEKHKMNQHAWDCANEYLADSSDGTQIILKEHVKSFAHTHELNWQTLYKRLTVNRAEWKK